jgi:UDP-N-acetylglucosamine diphosphorylase/glucosamine-1-phosphate N-acetyltransferase
MNYILADIDPDRFLPFTFTRPVCDMRFGILTIREKWQKQFGHDLYSITREYLNKKYPLNWNNCCNSIVINGAICPDAVLTERIQALQAGEALYANGVFIAAHMGEKAPIEFDLHGEHKRIEINLSELLLLEKVTDLFSKNGEALLSDFELLRKGRKSQKISDTNQVINAADIFIEEGAKVECSILNASTGPIYIAKDAEIMEGSMVRGPFALGEYATLKMGAKIYGPTTIGPHCKVGGEVSNSVFFGYSNKAHDGFVGNSVLGEWCNLGADTNTSNLKNNYSEVQLWDDAQKLYTHTGLQFCGLLMGDHSKTGINTMLNTGTWVGVSSNIFGGSFPKKYIPSFSWGGSTGFEPYDLDKAIDVAQRVYERRALQFDSKEQEIFRHLFHKNS